jgi:hypothetical protein
LSPWLLLIGRIDLQLANPESLSKPVHLSGGLQQWHVGAASVLLPAERLSALGAPLNTLSPSGRVRLVWNDLDANAMTVHCNCTASSRWNWTTWVRDCRRSIRSAVIACA